MLLQTTIGHFVWNAITDSIRRTWGGTKEGRLKGRERRMVKGRVLVRRDGRRIGYEYVERGRERREGMERGLKSE